MKKLWKVELELQVREDNGNAYGKYETMTVSTDMKDDARDAISKATEYWYHRKWEMARKIDAERKTPCICTAVSVVGVTQIGVLDLE